MKFQNDLSTLALETVVFIDEAGVDKFIIREYGLGTIGERVYGDCSGKRYDRESFIAGKIGSKLIAPFCYKGTCDTELFNFWLENILLPLLNPGATIVLDNASIHKSSKSEELVKSFNCNLLFLPPYSPDLNPIEKVWANIKSIIKKSISNFKTLSNAIDYAFKSIIQI